MKKYRGFNVPENGEEFRIWRKNKNMSQQEAADYLDYKLSAIAHLECENLPVSNRMTRRIERKIDTNFTVDNNIKRNINSIKKRQRFGHYLSDELEQTLSIINNQNFEDAERSTIFLTKALKEINEILSLECKSKDDMKKIDNITTTKMTNLRNLSNILIIDKGHSYTDYSESGKGPNWVLLENEIAGRVL